eukprot:5799757-Amphidinium_carterae.1
MQPPCRNQAQVTPGHDEGDPAALLKAFVDAQWPQASLAPKSPSTVDTKTLTSNLPIFHNY